MRISHNELILHRIRYPEGTQEKARIEFLGWLSNKTVTGCGSRRCAFVKGDDNRDCDCVIRIRGAFTE